MLASRLNRALQLLDAIDTRVKVDQNIAEGIATSESPLQSGACQPQTITITTASSYNNRALEQQLVHILSARLRKDASRGLFCGLTAPPYLYSSSPGRQCFALLLSNWRRVPGILVVNLVMATNSVSGSRYPIEGVGATHAPAGSIQTRHKPMLISNQWSGSSGMSVESCASCRYRRLVHCHSWGRSKDNGNVKTEVSGKCDSVIGDGKSEKNNDEEYEI